MSSTIIAQRNSVVHSSSLKTIIPSNLNLTSDQIRELAQLESWDIFSFKSLMKVMTSDNEGIHFYALENGHLEALAGNPNLSDFVIQLLIHRITSLESSTTAPRMGILVSRLSLNRTLMKEVNNLKKIISWLKEITPENPSQERNYILRFFREISQNLNSYNIEQIMTLASTWNELPNEVTQSGSYVRSHFSDWIYSNETTFKEWMKKNHPDFENLPMDWVLQIWGLSINSESFIPN